MSCPKSNKNRNDSGAYFKITNTYYGYNAMINLNFKKILLERVQELLFFIRQIGKFIILRFSSFSYPGGQTLY